MVTAQAIADARTEHVLLEGSDPPPKKKGAQATRWVLRELADACEALRDAEQRADDRARRRERRRDARARALPRLEPLGRDRDGHAYPRPRRNLKSRAGRVRGLSAFWPRRRRDPPPLTDRHGIARRYWLFPRVDAASAETPAETARPPSPFRVWREARGGAAADGEAPPWSYYEGLGEITALSAALDDRGAREAGLKASLDVFLPCDGLAEDLML